MTYDDLLKLIRESQSLRQQAEKLAVELGVSYTVEKYYNYRSHMDFEEFWHSSSATC